MKIFSLAFFILTIISASYAQESKFERKGGFRKNQMHRKMHHLMFTKRILSEKCIKKAEITEEQVVKLKREFEIIDKMMVKISSKIVEASKNQAEIAVKF
jgi:hemerythrin